MPDPSNSQITPPEQNRRNWEAFVRFARGITRAVLHPDRLWLQLATWTVVSVLVGIGIGTGFEVMGMTPPLFLVAKLCFIGSALIFWLKTLQWLVASKASRIERMILAFLIFGLSGMLLVEALRWINRTKPAHAVASSKPPETSPPPTTQSQLQTPPRTETVSPTPVPLVVSSPQGSPRLVGRLTCINLRAVGNTYMETLNPTVEHDYVIAINLGVTNDGATAAASRFELTVGGHAATELPVEKCLVKRTIKIPGGPPHHVQWDPLTPFPLNVEITNTTQQTGWVRFLVGLIKGLHVDHETGIKLTVFDHRDEPHVIYEGPIGQVQKCATIIERDGLGPSAEYDFQ